MISGSECVLGSSVEEGRKTKEAPDVGIKPVISGQD